MASLSEMLPGIGEGEGRSVELGILPDTSHDRDLEEMPTPSSRAPSDAVTECEPHHNFSNSPGNEKGQHSRSKKSFSDVAVDINEPNGDGVSAVQSDINKNYAIHHESSDIHFMETNMTRENNNGGSKLRSSASQHTDTKPGVILLGRGNSFSLGRSEVIVLHRRQKPGSDRKTSRKQFSSTNEKRPCTVEAGNNQSFPLQTIPEKQAGDVEVKWTSDVDDSAPFPPCSPPPVSNGLSHPDYDGVSNGERVNVSGRVVVDLVPSDDGDLRRLWHKVESVMTENNDRVRKILEEFGIGKPGGGGGEESDWENEDVEERKKEEEELWQIIQENVQA